MKKIITALGIAIMVVLIAMVGQSVQATLDAPQSTRAGGLVMVSGVVRSKTPKEYRVSRFIRITF